MSQGPFVGGHAEAGEVAEALAGSSVSNAQLHQEGQKGRNRSGDVS